MATVAKKRFDWKKWGFYAAIFAIPCLNFVIFSAGGLINTVALGFFGYDSLENVTYWNHFENFKKAFVAFRQENMLPMFGTSVIYYLISLVNMAMGYIIAFVIFKKMPFAETFRVLFFIPSIISGIVWASIFKYLVREPSFAQIFGSSLGLLALPNTARPTLMIYSLWLGMCGGVLTNVGFMGSISTELIEACHIDGCKTFGEFIHVILPQLWPFISVGLIGGAMGLFMSGPGLYEFYSTGADKELYSFSYYLFCLVMTDTSNKPNQMYSAACSLLVTCLVVPLTFGIKYLVNRFGPSED